MSFPPSTICSKIEKCRLQMEDFLSPHLDSIHFFRYECTPSSLITVQSGHSHESLLDRGLVRVSPNFRVIALGLPVPEFPGFPLDPPLRSRFQSRYVSAPPIHTQLQYLSSLIPHSTTLTVPPILLFFQAIERLKSAPDGLFAGHKLLPIPTRAYVHVSQFLAAFPQQMESFPHNLLRRVYPFHLFNLDLAQNSTLLKIIDSLETPTLKQTVPVLEKISQISDRLRVDYSTIGIQHESPHRCVISFRRDSEPSVIVTLSAVCGNHSTTLNSSVFVPVAPHLSAFSSMMQSHALGYDVCLVGTKGCGKSVLADFFAQSLGYTQPNKIFCYKDMTPRDLLQKRR
jgi:von Willebrand factor A domain-containing protein 8